MKNIKIIVFFLTYIISFSTNAQDDEKIRTAFSKSIEQETAKQYDKAILTLQNVYVETSYEINMRLGWLCYINNKIDESIVYYKKSTKLKPSSTEALWGLASPLSIKQKWVELNDTYIAIIKNDPKNSLANYYVGLYFYAEKNYAKAKTYFDVSLDLNPMDIEVCRMAAWTNYFMKNKELSIQLFNRVLIMNNTNPSALEGLTLAKKL
jgi:tetratricopeptide (TPR) repeat protein